MKKIVSFAVLLSLIVCLVGCSGSSNLRQDPPPCYVQLERNGEVYDEYAVQGQVWLLFDESVTPGAAEQILTENKAKILDKEPEIGYYLVEVKAGTEGAFVAQMNSCWEVDYVYPNAIYEAQSVTPCVIDNFYGDHGKMVVQMMEEAAKHKVTAFDVQYDSPNPKTREMYMADDKIKKSLSHCFKLASRENGVVINMSFTPGLRPDLERPLWPEQRISDKDRKNYRNRYIADLVGKVHYVRRHYRLKGKNFVIIKAAGNSGMPQMEEIINAVSKKLSTRDLKFFQEHFLIVSAKDDNKEGNYPNDISNGGYNMMFSKVDISDKTAEDLHWQGTSYASPRLAGYIARAAEEYDLDVTAVLPYIRRATKRSYDHVIDYQMIEEEITGKIIGNPKADLVGKVVYEPSSDGYLPKGWKWKLEKDDVLSVTETERLEQTPNEVRMLVYANLQRGLLKLDAEMELYYKLYKNEWKLSSSEVRSLTIPRQDDYSGYVSINVDKDFVPSLVAYNNSDYTLFICGDYTAGNKTSRYAVIAEPHSSCPIAMLGNFKEYHVHFAYRK